MYKHIVISLLSLAFVGMPWAQTAPAAQPSAKAATVQSSTSQPPANLAKVESQVVATPRGATATLDEMIQAKLDSMNHVATAVGSRNADSAAKVQADSVRKLVQQGKYVQRARYDKSNFDHWRIDTVLQERMKDQVVGVWRTPIIAHGHAFRDAELRFGANDTLVGITRTYSDSGRYQMTGEYTFKARYRFDSDQSLVSREVFRDRQVVRWDYITFDIVNDSLRYNLNKLEFRDLNDNWLNALQGFDNIPPELYIRDAKQSAELKQAAAAQTQNKKKK